MIALFYGVLTALVLGALVAEYAWGRWHRKRWYDTTDTLANLNLAAGNVLLGTITAGLILAAYVQVWEWRIFDAREALPAWAYWGLGLLLAELCQYWNHRLSHTYNFLIWGHVTHHSSSHLNLSTAPRVNWLYRSYAWLFYLPMPLLGWDVTAFVALQGVMNAYNLFMHTRLHVPFGPLRHVLVSPMAHRLHHTSDPRFFGNYGAALVVWDKVFGTYRELGPDDDPEALAFGIGHNVDEGDPLRLNFHWLADLWATSRATGRSFVGLLLSKDPPAVRTSRAPRGVPAPSAALWVAGAGVVLLATAISQLHEQLTPAVHAGALVLGVGATLAFGWWLQVTRGTV